MDLSDPTRTITSTLDGPVLAALAVAGRPLTVGEVAARAARGSEIGVRRSLARLVEQGIVTATEMGRNRVHELNREHVAAGVADALAGLRLELWRRMRAEVAGWREPPLFACVFGSAARGDGGVDSDIDVLLVQPMLSADLVGAAKGMSPLSAGLTALNATLTGKSGVNAERWQEQVDALREHVRAWTGNPAQVVDVTAREWLQPSADLRPLVAEVQRDAVELTEPSPLTRAVGRLGA